MNNNYSTSDRVQSLALTSTALEKRLLGLETVTQIALSKDIIHRTLLAKGKQFSDFNPTGILEFPKNAPAMRAIGLIAVTATFMLNAERNDFVNCNEDMATAIHSKIETSKFYKFLHGGLIDPKDASKGNDLLIKPDGLVCTLFDVDADDCAAEDMIVKMPRTSEQLRAERVSKAVKKDMYGDLNFSVFPHLTNKSYYTRNPEAADELYVTRRRVAKALAKSNPKAEQGQLCQALILGFVSSFYVMSSMHYESLKKQAKGEKVDTAPFGLGIYMPAWTILSKDIIKPQSGELEKLRGRKSYGGVSPIVNRKNTLRLLGLPTGTDKTSIKPLLESSNQLIEQVNMVEALKEEPMDIFLTEVSKTPDEIKVIEPDSPINENVKHDCEPEKESEAVNEIKRQALDRRKKKEVKTDSLGLGNLPPAPSKSSGTSASEEKKAVPPKTTRRRPMLSADDDATLG